MQPTLESGGKKKLAILYPIHYEQLMGGAELQISYLARCARTAGFEVYYIYEDTGKPITNYDHLVLCPLKRIKSFFGLHRRWFQYCGKINKTLNEIVPDLIYTRYTSSWNGFAAQYAKKHKIKHIHALTSDRVPSFELNFKLLLLPFDFFEPLLMCRGLKLASEVIVQNLNQQRILFSRFGRKGVLIDQMTPYVDGATIIKKNTPVQVLWIGNLKQIKRPEIFIELAGRLADLDVDHRMIMIGRFSLKFESIMNFANKNLPNFEYMGELSQSQVNDLLTKSHILVNTSEFEGFPNTFVQAWMRKVPVISMNSNPNEIITKFNVGFIAPTIFELENSIKSLISDSGLRERMGNNAYDYAIKNHTIENNIDKVISLLQVKELN